MKGLDFVYSRHFLRQLVIAAAIGVIIIWGSLKLLDMYTLHGQSIQVPDLDGYMEKEAGELLSALDLRYVINDSIFDETRPEGSIAWQDPAPGTEVKRNRTIYLTTVAILPEMVPMPDLVDLSHRHAMSILETHGLTVGRLEYQPDIARGAVLKQKFNEGVIEPGTPVQKGTAIDLVLGEGLDENITLVPLVIGMAREDAIRALNRAALNVGEEAIMDDHEENIKVYLQDPDPLDGSQYVQAGSTVDLFYRSTDVFDFEEYLEQLLSVPMPNLMGLSPHEVQMILEESELEIGMEAFEEGASRNNARVYRQEPEYQEGMIIPKGHAIDIWYEPVEEAAETEPEGIEIDQM